MLPTPPGKHLHLNCVFRQEGMWHLGPLRRAAQLRPQLSAVIGGKSG
jgi:hypothetical protein